MLTIWQLVDRFVWKWQNIDSFLQFVQKAVKFSYDENCISIIRSMRLAEKKNKKKNKSFVNYFTSFFDISLIIILNKKKEKQKQWLEIKLKNFLI